MTSYPVQEFGLKNLRTIHRLDRLTSGLLMFGRNPRKAREMEQQIRNRQVMILLSFSLCFISSFFSTRSCFYVAVKSLSGLLLVLCFFPSLFITSSFFFVFNVPICLAFFFPVFVFEFIDLIIYLKLFAGAERICLSGGRRIPRGQDRVQPACGGRQLQDWSMQGGKLEQSEHITLQLSHRCLRTVRSAGQSLSA